jgi:hypothetical protein
VNLKSHIQIILGQDVERLGERGGTNISEIEPCFVEALDRYLMDKGKAIEDIRKGIKKV